MDKIIVNDPDEITVTGLIVKLKAGIRYIKSKRLTLLVFAVLGVLIGVFYPVFIKPSYKALSTFVLEESSKGGGMGLGQYAGIASLAGIDLGSGSEKGLFQGDNILELYKSRLMLEKTLLTPVLIDGKNELLIDRYIQYNNLLDKWKNRNIGNVNFNNSPKKFSRAEDSILRDLTKYFNKHILTVSKPDKKLSIINVEIKSKDEVFAQLFNQTLVQTVNRFYIETQTKKTAQSVLVIAVHQSAGLMGSPGAAIFLKFRGSLLFQYK